MGVTILPLHIVALLKASKRHVDYKIRDVDREIGDFPIIRSMKLLLNTHLNFDTPAQAAYKLRRGPVTRGFGGEIDIRSMLQICTRKCVKFRISSK